MKHGYNELGLLRVERYNAFLGDRTGISDLDRYNAYRNLGESGMGTLKLGFHQNDRAGLVGLTKYNAYHNLHQDKTGLVGLTRYQAYHNLTSSEKARLAFLQEKADTSPLEVTDEEWDEYNELIRKKGRTADIISRGLDWLSDLFDKPPEYGEPGYVPSDDDDDDKNGKILGMSPALFGILLVGTLVGGGILIYRATKKK